MHVQNVLNGQQMQLGVLKEIWHVKYFTFFFSALCNELGVVQFITFHDSLSLYNIHLHSAAYLNTSSTPATKPVCFKNICCHTHTSSSSSDVSRTV